MVEQAGLQYLRGRHDDLFRLLVESVKDYAIFVLDPNGYIRSWNAGAARIKGYDAQEIIGKHFSIFYPSHEIQRGKPEYELRVAADEGRWEEEGWRLRKDGSLFWASVVITALYDPQRTLVGFAKVTRDLTERRRAEEDRLQLVKREQATRAEVEVAERTLRAQDEFLAVAAHELKTPLTGARLASQLLRRHHDALPPELRGPIEMMDLQVDKLGRLVTQLLETVRLQIGRFVLDKEDVDVAALASMVVKHMRQSDKIDVVAEGPIIARVDALRLEQVLTNLLDNAVKFSPDNARIGITVEQLASEMMRIVVRDHGPGVPPEQRRHIFERYFQAHSESHQSGLGLGLYICRQIVVEHGGDIAAEFPPDGGTKIVVTLPSKPSEPATQGTVRE
jgi:PAS domain S-box-containing protein